MRNSDNDNNGLIDSSNSDLGFKVDDANSYNPVVGLFDKYSERFTTHMPTPMLEMANPPENAKILDVGTGTGIIALSVAENLNGQGSILGIDLSDGMLEFARSKARQRKLGDQVEFRKMDAENLELASETFDAALSLYALRHFPDPAKSVKEIFRVLKPGGNIVVAVGSRPPLISSAGLTAAVRRVGSFSRRMQGKELVACEFIDTLVEKYLPEPVRKETAGWVGNRHGFSGSIKELVTEAGFTSVTSGWKGQYSMIDSPEDFWQIQMTFSSLARKRIANADDETTKKLKSEFIESCERVLERKGRLVYQTGAAIVGGMKPRR